MLGVNFVVLIGSQYLFLYTGREIDCCGIVVIGLNRQPIHFTGHVTDLVQLL